MIIGVRGIPTYALVLHGDDTFRFSVVVLISLYLVLGLNNLIVRIVLVEMNDHRDWLLGTHLLELHLLLLQLGGHLGVLHRELVHLVLLEYVYVQGLTGRISYVHVHTTLPCLLILWQVLIIDRLDLLL